jgi:electron transport complex protein RnfD
MYGIIIALTPSLLYGIYLFGMGAARVIALSAVTTVVSEYLILRLFKKKITVGDGSALLSGLLLGALLPATAPFWLVITGGFMSMLVGKHVFGGLGSHPFNAPLVGWAMLTISWKPLMDLNLPGTANKIGYPLGLLQSKGTAGIFSLSLLDLFIGKETGGIGTTSVLLLGIGGIVLICKGLISWRAPVSFLSGTAVTAFLFNVINPAMYAGPVFHLCTGMTVIGAFFLAPDYSSSPISRKGCLIFGFGCGFFTILFRVWSVYPDGTPFAILIMNMLTPFLDRIGYVKGKSQL